RVAAHLHDGVLQTLAMIERRSDSPEIARLARDQERDLRGYLFAGQPREGGLESVLRSTATRAEQAWPGLRVTVSISEDAAGSEPEIVEAVGGAVTEALTNAAKHGRATTTVVFADLDDRTGGLFVSVKDDGQGFDPASVPEGVGMRTSIRARIESVGGTVEV